MRFDCIYKYTCDFNESSSLDSLIFFFDRDLSKGVTHRGSNTLSSDTSLSYSFNDISLKKSLFNDM